MGRMLRYFFTSTKKGAEWAHQVNECFEHQSIHHDLPREHIYTKETMSKELERFSSEGKFYEVSVLAMILADWKFDHRRFCNFQYN